MKEMYERFLRYVSVDTRSDDRSDSFPSTPGQKELLSMLFEELKEMGVDPDYDSENGYLYACLPPSEGCEKAPAIGFISHVDTSPDAPGKNVRPRLLEKYDGGDIQLCSEGRVFIRPSEFPEIMRFKGKSVIVTDGTTLLGADDKAGVTEIMEAVKKLSEDSSIAHGKVCIAFTPDEELGLGASRFDTERFGAVYAYTVDGSAFPEFEYENFNAAGARVYFKGRGIHPGSAKGIMKNALSMAIRLDSMLPEGERPECTEGREGFFHLESLEGDVSSALSEYIIRDGDADSFQERKKIFLNACEYINRLYGPGSCRVELKDTYYNMGPEILKERHLIDNAKRAFEMCSAEMKPVFIRGGTDGATLSYRGLPCPNLPTGGINYHSVYECACLDDMVKVRDLILNIISLYSREG
ncbi:MAG: peptidase T [Lachnospiraceae bacterium]|nr:peptidase T [Lachnospiraceae bacterium]